jgi:soluble lytic murein transglycosylase
MGKAKHGLFAFSMTLILGSACQSNRLHHEVQSTIPIDQSAWAKDYRIAAEMIEANQTEKACALFKNLANIEKFPGRQLAKLREMKACPEQSEQKDESVKIEDYPPYIRDLALEAALAVARKRGDQVAEMDLAVEKSKQRLSQKEKVAWLQRAMELADALKADGKLADLRKRLYSIAPRLNPQPSLSDWLMVAADYRSHRDFTKAIAYYERVIEDKRFTLQDKIAALKGIRLAHKNARKIEAHIDTSRRLVNYLEGAMKLSPGSGIVRDAYYDAQTFYARALWTHGQAAEAREVFDRIEKTLKGRGVSLAELYWLRGRMAEEDGKLDEVALNMTAALDEEIRDSELRDKITWYSAWNERRRKDLNRAVSLLSDLESRTQSEFTRVRALFWLGKTFLENKQETEAKITFARLAELDPLGYYGLLARRQLDIGISFRLNGKAPAMNDKVDIPLDRTLADWLIALDEREALTNLLDQAANVYNRHPHQTDEGWVELFKYYARGGLYMKLYETLGALSPDRRKNVLETHPELLFPQPWNEDVRMASLQFGVDEELIYAIMRQESAFDPRARSVADAFGLMQVLPEVAERLNLNRDQKIAYTHVEDLYTARTNINIGTAHLKELLRRHKNQFILAVASYNANETAIRKWMRTRYRGDSLEFIEEIPYEETRTYVRLVMRNLICYSLLKSKSASIRFPAWVLTLDPS